MCMPGAAEQIQSLVDDAASKGAKVRRLEHCAHMSCMHLYVYISATHQSAANTKAAGPVPRLLCLHVGVTNEYCTPPLPPARCLSVVS